MVASSGRAQRRQTPMAAAHTPNLQHFYRYSLPPLIPGDFEFQLTLRRPGLPPFPLDHTVELLNWVDEQSVMTGSMTLRRPDPQDPSSLPLSRAHLIDCKVKWDQGTYDLWTMRCDPPQIQVDAGTISVTLQDDMALLDSDRADWIFRQTARRPYGFTCDEIARAVASALGMKVGNLAHGTLRFSLTKRKSSGLAVLRAAYAKEKAHSGRTFVIRMRNGRLEVVELQRNPLIYVLANQIQTALITQKAGETIPATILTGRARTGLGRSARKISYTFYDRQVIKVLGAVRRTKDYGRVGSHAELRDLVKRDLAKQLRVNDTIEVTHQGIPFIRRGDCAQVSLPQEGYGGAQSFVFATSANHTVQAGVYTSNWVFSLSDPYLGLVTPAASATKRRAAKRTVRKRTKLRGRP